MEVSNAIRQVEEILVLRDKWYSDFVDLTTPALFNKLQRIKPSAKGTIDVKKCLSFYVKCSVLHPDELSDFILWIEFPKEYPSQITCLVKALKSSNLEFEYESCTAAIETYLRPFAGYECVELILDWLADNKDTCLKISDKAFPVSNLSSNEEKNDMVKCYVLRYNHLFSGPQHKKEKSMLDAAKKSKLQGGVIWGTPGIVIVVEPSTEDDSKLFATECRAIGKRADGVQEVWLPKDGVEVAGLGGLAQQKRGGKLRELEPADLRMACGSNEELLRIVLGVH
mmetsp:Transcript_2253/g.3156  ORF Transcript_2253/g.3156 Transcript_2253/m.3156 type:complete len:282 (-) Transcript_2253:484-1329(-)